MILLMRFQVDKCIPILVQKNKFAIKDTFYSICGLNQPMQIYAAWWKNLGKEII